MQKLFFLLAIILVFLFSVFFPLTGRAADDLNNCKTSPPKVCTAQGSGDKYCDCMFGSGVKGDVEICLKSAGCESNSGAKTEQNTTPGCQPQDNNGQVICTLENPLQNKKATVPYLIGQVAKAAIGLIGALALYMFIRGGGTWLLAAGNAEKIHEGSRMMIWAAVGILVVFTSYAVLIFVLQSLPPPAK